MTPAKPRFPGISGAVIEVTDLLFRVLPAPAQCADGRSVPRPK